MLLVRPATDADLASILHVYNQGIEDGEATLETQPKSTGDMAGWWAQHDERYAVLLAQADGDVVGWASLNRFSQRCAHSAIADLSVYVERRWRGRGIGLELLVQLEQRAVAGDFHKIVLHALNSNESGKRLYAKAGFREVGVFREHGTIDDRYVDVVAMEKLLRR
jgi:L-amino acid N-acyltransferase YncA